MYFCPGAGHAPHHIFREWADRYRGQFDLGYEAIRETILARQKAMGILPEAAELSPIVSWPAGIQARGGIRRQYCHAVDIVPTLYQALGVELPDV